MKICVINSLYPPYHRGGAEVMAEKEVKQLRLEGHDVFVITIRPWLAYKSLWPIVEELDGVRVYRFYPLNLFSFININKISWWWRLPWHKIDLLNLHSYLVVKNILKQEQPDLVRTHNLKGIGYTVWRAIKNLKIKNVHTIHDVQLVVPSGLLKVGEERKLNNWFYKSYAAVCRLLIDSPMEVISPSQWLMDFYTSRGFFKHSVKTVDLAFGQLPLTKQLNLQPQKKVINLLYVGQIEEHKGILWLIRKLKNYELRITNYELGNSFHLDIVGNGSKLNKVRKLVAGDERFKVWGWVPAEKLGGFFLTADFTVVPSLVYENSPTIITTSLGHKVPVIARKIGGIPELIKAGETGWFLAD